MEDKNIFKWNNKVTEEEFLKYVKNLGNNLTTTEFARLYNMSGSAFNKVLAKYNVQYKKKYNGKTLWILKKDFKNKGLQDSKFRSYKTKDDEIINYKEQSKWTKKGICYIYYFLKNYGIEPVLLKSEHTEIEAKLEQLSFL